MICDKQQIIFRYIFGTSYLYFKVETTLQSVEDGKIICKDKTGKEIPISCDSVISSAGYISSPLAQEGKNVYLVGDCKQVGNLRSVVWRAYEVAMKI